MDELEEARRAIEELQRFDDRIENMLSDRPNSAGTAQLIAATAQLKSDIKAANSESSRGGMKKETSRGEQQFATAMSRAVAAFRMRADTNPSRPVWQRELRDVQGELRDFAKRLRTEFPQA